MNTHVQNIIELLNDDRKNTMERIQGYEESFQEPESTKGDNNDQASQLTENQTNYAIRDELVSKVRKIDQALARAKANPDEFGMCRNCGCEIPIGRIEAIPFATMCCECQEDEDNR